MRKENDDAQRLRQARVASGMSTTAFAQALGVSRITLWRWETGRREAPRWVGLAVPHVAIQSGARAPI